MALLTKSYLRQKVQKKTQAEFGSINESTMRNFSGESLANEKRAASVVQTYDIFLCHASEDAILIKALRDELVEHGHSVYVDWIEDPQLDRRHVTKETAATLRKRMGQCRCLLFATSEAARKSDWTPWELGYMDARTCSRVAIVPIVPDGKENEDFKGQEYLGLYPYFDKTGTDLYIHTTKNQFAGFTRWIQGADPVPH